MQRISKFKNAVVMGVAAIQCARHGFYMPQSIVDLDLGEGYFGSLVPDFGSLTPP
jgi:hypothetical protein